MDCEWIVDSANNFDFPILSGCLAWSCEAGQFLKKARSDYVLKVVWLVHSP
jgi:hypothetical protein